MSAASPQRRSSDHPHITIGAPFIDGHPTVTINQGPNQRLRFTGAPQEYEVIQLPGSYSIAPHHTTSSTSSIRECHSPVFDITIKFRCVPIVNIGPAGPRPARKKKNRRGKR